MPAPTIRLATREDVGRLPDIERRAASRFRDTQTETGLTRESLDRTAPTTVLVDAVRSGRLWVAEAPGGAVVGFGLVVEVARHAHLDELSVLPSHARQGVGTALLEAIRAWAEKAGHLAVTLITYRDVPWNAPFYRRRGFSVVDAENLSAAHERLVAAEATRGLRTDRRVVMVQRLRS